MSLPVALEFASANIGVSNACNTNQQIVHEEARAIKRYLCKFERRKRHYSADLPPSPIGRGDETNAHNFDYCGAHEEPVIGMKHVMVTFTKPSHCNVRLVSWVQRLIVRLI